MRWVRNFPLALAYDHPDVELIVAFRYLPQYPQLGVEALAPLRRRLRRFARIAPVQALLAELDEAEARIGRGEPGHMAEMIARLARVSILRNTKREERLAEQTDQSLRELRSLRHDVLERIEDDATRADVERRFAAAQFPFRHDRLVPRIVVRGTVEGVGLEPGFRTQPHWSVEEKRGLIARGYELADRELAQIEIEIVDRDQIRSSATCSRHMTRNEPPPASAIDRRVPLARASGTSSVSESQTIAPAAKPSPTGRNDRTCSTNRNAGTATSGCGRLEKTLHQAAVRTRAPRGTSTRLIARPSGMLWMAIATVTKMPRASPPP